MRIEYNGQGNITRIREDTYHNNYGDNWIKESFLFYSNGALASYFKVWRWDTTVYTAEYLMEQCTYDANGNLLTSVSGRGQPNSQWSHQLTNPNCANGGACNMNCVNRKIG